jgi:hypothetical protein
VTKTTPGIEPIIGDQGARHTLERTLRRLDGSSGLVLELAAEGRDPRWALRAAHVERKEAERETARAREVAAAALQHR